jgi:ATP-dependent Clp protease ATP-binding subunit ClpA
MRRFAAGLEKDLPFTPRAKRVLELALREALSLGHNYIGTEHLLLGLVRESEGVAARILLDFAADSEKIRKEVIRCSPAPAAARAPAASVEDSRRDAVPTTEPGLSQVGRFPTRNSRI